MIQAGECVGGEVSLMPAKEEIERLAYFLWVEEGRPHGVHLKHYYEAERILRERELSMQRINGTGSPPITKPVAPAPAAMKPDGASPTKGPSNTEPMAGASYPEKRPTSPKRRTTTKKRSPE
jgi:hypothetical protein